VPKVVRKSGAAPTNGAEAPRAAGPQRQRAERPPEEAGVPRRELGQGDLLQVAGPGREQGIRRRVWEAARRELGQEHRLHAVGREVAQERPRQAAALPENRALDWLPETASRASKRRSGSRRGAPAWAAHPPPVGPPASAPPRRSHRRGLAWPAPHSRQKPPPLSAASRRRLLLRRPARPAPRPRPRTARPWASRGTRASPGGPKGCAPAWPQAPAPRVRRRGAPRWKDPMASSDCPPIPPYRRPARGADRKAARPAASAAGGCWPGGAAPARPERSGKGKAPATTVEGR